MEDMVVFTLELVVELMVTVIEIDWSETNVGLVRELSLMIKL